MFGKTYSYLSFVSSLKFSYKAAEELNDIGVKWFKIGSGEFLDTPFIERIINIELF